MPKKKKARPETIKIKQVRSLIGHNNGMRETVKGLGLRRIGHEVEVEATPSVRGMLMKVHHLVQIVEGE